MKMKSNPRCALKTFDSNYCIYMRSCLAGIIVVNH